MDFLLKQCQLNILKDVKTACKFTVNGAYHLSLSQPTLVATILGSTY